MEGSELGRVLKIARLLRGLGYLRVPEWLILYGKLVAEYILYQSHGNPSWVNEMFVVKSFGPCEHVCFRRCFSFQNTPLGGGFKYFLCSPLFGEDFQID